MTARYEIEHEFAMPDRSIGLSERELYGYKGADMLPLLQERALELFDSDHTIYMLNEDGTEAMVFERGEITAHEGIFGIEASEWIASKEYADMIRSVDGEAAKESALIFGGENAFAIYQLKSGSQTRDYRFESMDNLTLHGLTVDRANYELVYTAPLMISDTITNLNKIYETFNIDRPADFTGRSLSVSDVIVLQCHGKISSHYVDNIGFGELPAFLGNEQPQVIQVKPPVQVAPEKEDTPKPIIQPAAKKIQPEQSGKKIKRSILAQIENYKSGAASSKAPVKSTEEI